MKRGLIGAFLMLCLFGLFPFEARAESLYCQPEGTDYLLYLEENGDGTLTVTGSSLQSSGRSAE